MLLFLDAPGQTGRGGQLCFARLWQALTGEKSKAQEAVGESFLEGESSVQT